MIAILLLIAAFIVFDILTQLWGVDSRDGFTSSEWTRRLTWRNPSYEPLPY
jgi:hypothetical protein